MRVRLGQRSAFPYIVRYNPGSTPEPNPDWQTDYQENHETKSPYIFCFVAALLSLFRAKAQPTLANLGAKEIARHGLTGPQKAMEAVLVEVTSAAGAPSHIHRHPGFVLGYVLDGELKFAINNGAPQAIPRGGTFFEPAGVLHSTGESAELAQPVRFLAFLVLSKGSPIVLPA